MKRICMIATGGTIASAEDGSGLAPALSGQELAAYVPEVKSICKLEIQQLMNIDSTNMRPADWLRIGTAVISAYDRFDGFVVLHGTDTMAYTAAALSYLIQGSPKPIVLTGSQQPMASPFTDAKLNLYQSLLYASDPRSRDVSIVFGGAVVAGTRARKQRTMSFNAFTSVNFPEIALIRGNRVIRAADAARPSTAAQGSSETAARHAEGEKSTMPGARAGSRTAASPGAPSAGCAAQAATAHATARTQQAAGASELPIRPAHVYDRLDDRVCVLKLTPGIGPELFDLLKRDYQELIVETFGIGGIPDTLRAAVFDWVNSGRALVVTTQVPEEWLNLGVYEVGRAYAEHPGILKGDDMTTEALVAKTMWALGQTSDPAKIQELFYRPVNFDRLPNA